MTRPIQQLEFERSSPRLLIVGELRTRVPANNAWYQTTLVPTLKAASDALRMQHYDVVLSAVSMGNEEGLALPGLLLELKKNGVLSQLPRVLLCSDIAPNILGAHVQLAYDAGVAVQLAPALGFYTAQHIMSLLAKGSPAPARTLAGRSPGVSSQDFLVALLSGRDIRIVVQPQVDLESGRPVGAEALVRWRHPVLGDISPSVFVPLANEAGMGQLLFHFVLTKVVSLLRKLRQRAVELPISLNACADTLCTPGLVDLLQRHLRYEGLTSSLLKLELTEDVPANDLLALSTAVSTLRMRGFSVALDDYGRGASTLDLLTRLAFSELKIDGHFVRGMGQRPGCTAAVKGAIAIAREMGMGCIAEGMETPQQVQALLGAGCRVGQGFVLSRPLEVEDFIAAVSSARPLMRWAS